ncbi:enoyl-CoA hydratase/isomerase family protein [Variovorax sp. VaC1]|uniref:enoyl-CoA hydratase/isomerase family protein n=1 Tax=Variovorax sp. VaC1 TaxID=3373132 RepID=UPI003747B227
MTTSSSPSSFIACDIDGHVATIALDRPERRNAFDLEMRAQMFDAIRGAVDNPQVRAIVLTGRGGHFCAGGDVKGMREIERLEAAAGRLRMKDAQAGMRLLMQSDKPVIAAVEGCAYGGGFGLALAADIVLAAPSARFCMSFMKVGLVPDCGSLFTLARSVGLNRAKALMLSARELDAQTAMDWGIVHEVIAADALLPHAQAIAAALANGPATAIALTKQGLQRTHDSDMDAMFEFEAMAQGLAFATDDHRQAIDDFTQRRPARFQWPATPATSSSPSSTS